MKKILFISFLLFLCNCISNNGAKFNELIKPKEDEAVVYFYRPSISGTLVKYPITDENNQKITTMYVKSYYPYITKNLGTREFKSKLDGLGKISLNLESGEVYFVKTSIGLYVTFGKVGNEPQFKLIENKEKALKDLKQCSLSKD